MGADKDQLGVYAMLRWDRFLADRQPENCVTVKEVVHSLELAEAEVDRLNALREDRAVHYWWQYTRLYPSGKSAQALTRDRRTSAKRCPCRSIVAREVHAVAAAGVFDLEAAGAEGFGHGHRHFGFGQQ